MSFTFLQNKDRDPIMLPRVLHTTLSRKLNYPKLIKRKTCLQPFFLCMLIIFPGSLTAEGESDIKSIWQNGYHVVSGDNNFRLKFGGRIQHHFSFFNQDKDVENLLGSLDNGSEFRRIRFYNSGTIYKSVQYKLQLNYSEGAASLADVWVGLTGIPFIGNLRVGHLKEAFSLDMMTSSNNITFLERALVTAFKKQRNSGISIFNTVLNQKLIWAIGLFQNTDKFGNSIDEGQNLTSRVVYLPYYNKNKNRLLHIGAGYSSRTPPNNEFSIKSRPEAHLAPAYINTGTIEGATSSYMTGGELAVLLNRFGMQGEFMTTEVNSDSGNFTFNGFYVETSLFLTDDHRTYSTSTGAYTGINPRRSFSSEESNQGLGAWQIALRYSYLDLTDQDISGGILSDVTAGLNWYLNPATRISLNYTIANLENVGQSNIFQSKFQVAF